MIYDTTFHGLHMWVKHVAEHLGWVIIANAQGHTHRVAEYRRCLKDLAESLDKKLKDITDVDRRADLEILQKKVKVLSEHVAKDFPSPAAPGAVGAADVVVEQAAGAKRRGRKAAARA